jgi:hypothetical protein
VSRRLTQFCCGLSPAANGRAGVAIKVTADAGHSAVDGITHVPGTAEGVAAVDPAATDTATAGDAAGGGAAGGLVIVEKTTTADSQTRSQSHRDDSTIQDLVHVLILATLMKSSFIQTLTTAETFKKTKLKVPPFC